MPDFLTSILSAAGNPVAVDRRPCLPGRNEDIFIAIRRAEERADESVAFRLQMYEANQLARSRTRNRLRLLARVAPILRAARIDRRGRIFLRVSAEANSLRERRGNVRSFCLRSR